MFLFAKPCAERFTFPDCGDVNECHPGRAAAWEDPKALPRFAVIPDDGLSNDPPLRLPLSPVCPRTSLFASRGEEFARDVEKNRCDPGVPVRMVDALAARFVGL